MPRGSEPKRVEGGCSRSRSTSFGSSEEPVGFLVESETGDECMLDQQSQSNLFCGNGCPPALSCARRSSLMEELGKHPEADVLSTSPPAYFASVPPPPLPMVALDLATREPCCYSQCAKCKPVRKLHLKGCGCCHVDAKRKQKLKTQIRAKLDAMNTMQPPMPFPPDVPPPFPIDVPFMYSGLMTQS